MSQNKSESPQNSTESPGEAAQLSDDTEPRPRGILSPDDRGFLLGQKSDLTKQSRRDARYRIRQRIIESVRDFELLASSLAAKDTDLVFDKMSEDFHTLLIGALQFLYYGSQHIWGEKADGKFESVLSRAITRVHHDEDPGQIVDIDVSIDVAQSFPDIDMVLERYENGEATPEEVQLLYRTDNIGLEDLFEHAAESGKGVTVNVRSLTQIAQNDTIELGPDDIRRIFESKQNSDG